MPEQAAGEAPEGELPSEAPRQLAGPPVPLLGVQRALETVSPALGAALQPLGLDAAGVQVHRDEQATRTAGRLEARAFTAAGEIHLPARHGSLDAPPGQALLAHELVHVAQQRRLGVSRLAEHTASGQELEREAVTVEREVLDPRSTALASGAASLDGDGAVVFARPAGELPGTAAPGVDAMPAVQRAPEASPVATAPEAPAAPAGAPGGDLDELARRLYDRIRSRLKAELRLDRERSGHLTDLRH
jgi:hypothetical protein